MKDRPRLFVNVAVTPPMRAALQQDLSPGHAHYLGTVLRMGAGDEVLLFNQRDGEWRAQIVDLRRGRGQVRLLDQMRPAQRSPGLTLLFAPLKRDATDLVVRMGTELGVAHFHPVLTERTNTHRLNLDRLEAIAIEAAEQCERMDAPVISAPARLASSLAGWPAGQRLFVAAERLVQPMEVCEVNAVSDGDGLLVGPEGGFSDSEIAMLRAQPYVTMISLGPLVLRADTAVASGLSMIGAGLRRVSGAGSR
ncbi:16S rRNA (uracil(1498)-N(3))-methyltransferase [Nguyenibacter vanlangensis]|uniref:Ribosomal RNA small subunit methyltransferase E n=1 Tax=Nguyenibacter vanlangensis TaxID=1216886 RepID=A0ABZ3D517_9PROT